MKKIFAVILCIALAFSLAACGASKGESDSIAMTESAAQGNFKENGIYFSADTSLNDFDEAPAQGQTKSEEKIIRTVDLNVQTKEYDAYLAALNASVVACGGYVETSESDMGGYYDSNRYSTYTVRIPAEKLDEFLTSASEKGKITSKTESQKNVTLDYVDLESRISAFKTERETLMNLLEKAESLENILSIQERLSEVNYEIESYTAQLRVLENRVSYSTVTLRISEVERVSGAKPTLWSRIKDNFLDNVDALIDGLEDIAVGIIGGLPIILPFAAVAVAVILILRKIIRKRRNKNS